MKENVSKRIELSPNFSINTILNGLWQLSGGHGNIKLEEALLAMKAYHEAGFLTWDLADHYGFAEDLIGMFYKQKGNNITKLTEQPRFLTKWVPRPGQITRVIVENAINRSLKRMGVKSLDMLQFHWWDYSDDNYLTALEILDDLRKEGKIKNLSLTNFDTAHLEIIIKHGIPIVSNQIQFSLIDQRPLKRMVPYCSKQDIKLLAYGTLGGGLYTNRFYPNEKPRSKDLSTSSLQKYFGIISQWGNWAQFQKFMGIVNKIAQKHEVSMANVAVRYILEQPAVAGAIIGARLSLSNNIEATEKIYSFHLDEGDHELIRSAYAEGADLFGKIGDCGDEYR